MSIDQVQLNLLFIRWNFIEKTSTKSWAESKLKEKSTCINLSANSMSLICYSFLLLF